MTEEFVPAPPNRWTDDEPDGVTGDDDAFPEDDAFADPGSFGSGPFVHPDAAEFERPDTDDVPAPPVAPLALRPSLRLSDADAPDPATDEVLRDDLSFEGAPRGKNPTSTWIDEGTPVPARSSARPPAPAAGPPHPPTEPPAPERNDLGYIETGKMRTDTTDDGWSLYAEDDDLPEPPRVVERSVPIASDPPAEQAAPAGSSFSMGDDPTDSAELGDFADPGQADFLDDLYNSFDFDSSPPTDEVTEAVYEDVSQHSPGSMDVPQTADLAKLIEKATPAPVPRRSEPMRSPDLPNDAFERADDVQPPPKATPNRFLDTGTPIPQAPRMDAPPVPSDGDPWALDDEFSAQKPNAATEEPEQSNPYGRLFVAGVGGLVLAIGLVVVAVLPSLELGALAPRPSPEGAPPDPIISAAPAGRDGSIKGVPVRNSLHGQPGMFGIDDADNTPLPPAAPREVRARDLARPSPRPSPRSAPAPSGDVIAEGGAAPELPTPEVAPEPEPAAAAPRPRPRPAPAPAAVPSPAAAAGTLKIRSNRRVVVYVNETAIGYTPKDYPVPLGAYSIRAMVPGMPDTQQTKQTAVEAEGQAVAVSFTF